MKYYESYSANNFFANATNPLFLKIFTHIPSRLKNDLVECQKNPLMLSGEYNQDVFEACIAWAVRAERVWFKEEFGWATAEEVRRQNPFYKKSMTWLEDKLKKKIYSCEEIPSFYRFKHLDSIAFNGRLVGSERVIEKMISDSWEISPSNFSKISLVLKSSNYDCFRKDEDMNKSIDEILNIIQSV